MAEGRAAAVTGEAPAIEVRGLTHRFGPTLVLDGIDLSVRPGQVYGFLGRNGAGKTTLIRSLLGLLSPSAGEVRLLGRPVHGGRTPADLWSQVGYLVEGPGLYPTLTVRDHLAIAARYRRLSPQAIDEIIEQLALGPFADVAARALSLGNRQRLGLALALAHRPRLVVLDEPVNGLDPAGVVEVRRLVRSLADEGVTVFMSSHLIAEVARLADRVGVIHGGLLVDELDADQLSGPSRLVSTFRSPDIARSALAALRAERIEATPSTADPATTVESVDPAALVSPDRVARIIVAAGAAPTSLTVEHMDLEDLFLELTGGVAA
ncbi:MAG: ABC transporter ATP-binding protein [Acidimicrobiales bacterium]